MTRHSPKNSTALSGGDFFKILPPLLVSVVILAVLYTVLDYTTGYGQKRISILAQLLPQWQMEDWSHCMMVPFGALLIVYLDRARLVLIPRRGAVSGLIALAAGFLLYWFGFKADNIYFSYAAAELLIAGFIIWFAGWGWMRALTFPVLFLLFMWPLLFLESFIAFPLRLVVSHSGATILNLIGIPTVLNGTGLLSAADPALHLAEGQRFAVDVALPCSGIRSLFALLMVGALYGYFAVSGTWRKLVIFALAVPLAIVGNIARVVMLTIGTIALGPAKAIGTLEHPSFFHMMAGYLVFIVALGGMIGLGALLEAIRPVESSERGIPSASAAPVSPKPQGKQVGETSEEPEDLY